MAISKGNFIICDTETTGRSKALSIMDNKVQCKDKGAFKTWELGDVKPLWIKKAFGYKPTWILPWDSPRPVDLLQFMRLWREENENVRKKAIASKKVIIQNPIELDRLVEMSALQKMMATIAGDKMNVLLLIVFLGIGAVFGYLIGHGGSF